MSPAENIWSKFRRFSVQFKNRHFSSVLDSVDICQHVPYIMYIGVYHYFFVIKFSSAVSSNVQGDFNLWCGLFTNTAAVRL